MSYQIAGQGPLVGVERRVQSIVQNLPVPVDRRVWHECQAVVSAGYQVNVDCPRGSGDPSHQVIDDVQRAVCARSFSHYAAGFPKSGQIADSPRFPRSHTMVRMRTEIV